jgi:hypothetical protein
MQGPESSLQHSEKKYIKEHTRAKVKWRHISQCWHKYSLKFQWIGKCRHKLETKSPKVVS